MHGPMGPRGAPVGIEGRTVTGAPFRAQIVSSASQTVADGSHITHNSTAKVARDGQGRTFLQQGVTPERTITFLQDPVAHTAHVISAADKTARPSRVIEYRHEGAPGTRFEARSMHARSGGIWRRSRLFPRPGIRRISRWWS